MSSRTSSEPGPRSVRPPGSSLVGERGQQPAELSSARRITIASIAISAALTAAKIVAGWACSSQAILVDGLHSGSDLATDIAVLAGLRASSKPADGCHLYGHRRVGTLVAMVIGAFLLVAAGTFGVRAIQSLRTPTSEVRAGLPLWLALATVPIKELLFRLTRRAGRSTGNLSLIANAWHHRTDALAALAAAAGLAGVLLGGPGWYFLDALTAFVLVAFLAAVAARIINSAASELIDRAPDRRALEGIESVVSQIEGVRSYHAFRARSLGGKVAMDVHIQVDPSLTVQAGHGIASQVEQKVIETNPDVIEVIVHIEPAEDPQAAKAAGDYPRRRSN